MVLETKKRKIAKSPGKDRVNNQMVEIEEGRILLCGVQGGDKTGFRRWGRFSG